MLSLLLKTEKKLLILVVITVLAVVFRPWILVSDYALDPRQDYTKRLYNDAAEGGFSKSLWLDEANNHWRCIINGGFDYPYCSYELYPGNSFVEGINLSAYQSMRIWLRYQGPAQMIRIYLRNFDAAYSQDNDFRSTKYNVIAFEKQLLDEKGYLELSLDKFSVSDWWLQENRIPLRHAHPEFNNVVIIEVQTGSAGAVGQHDFQLERIEFQRQLISTERWYLMIIMAWVASILGVLIFRLASLKKELTQRQRKESELTQLNTLLDKQAKSMAVKASRDPLTGVFNREGVEESLVDALNEWHMNAKRLCIVLLDLDYFKQVNDTYGHGVGDNVLVELASLVTRNVRSCDKFARWGGEEFLLVCCNSELSETSILAEKLRKLIANHKFADDVKMTASFGVAAIKVGESLENLFKRADEALYKAKRTSRNCVMVSDD